MPVITADPIVQRLRALAKDDPDLGEAAALYEIILPLLRSADLHVTPLPLTREEAHAKLELGLPLLHDAELALDDEAARDLLIELARAVEKSGERLPPDAPALYALADAGDEPRGESGASAGLRAAAARQIRLTLEQNNLELSTLLPRVAAGDSGYVTTLAQSLKLDPALLWTLAQSAFKPALRDWAKELMPLARESEWHRGYCFICGAGATLGELQGNDQIKHLRCSQCGSDWVFRRIQCMYCGNDDHTTLGYFYADAQREKLRVEVCDRCHGYLKVIAAFDPTPSELLPVEDLATLHLDYIAQEQGYARVAIQ
jgi:formate dehydrogenase formation protein